MSKSSSGQALRWINRPHNETLKSKLTATDLGHMTICRRKLYLKHHGDPTTQVDPSALEQMLRQEGLRYQQTVINPSRFELLPVHSLPEGVAATRQAMQNGVAEIYRGILAREGLIGQPDLLIRTTGNSAWGNYHYRPMEVKLSKSLKPYHQRQMMTILYLLAQLQQVETSGLLHLGDGSQVEVTLTPEFAPWLSMAQQIKAGQVEPEPFIGSHCKRCIWQRACRQVVEQQESITILPQISRKVTTTLQQEGLTTLSDLAACHPADLTHLKGIGKKTARMLVHRSQAFLRNEAVVVKRPSLPARPQTEYYLDLESVPYQHGTARGQCVYLFGWLERHPNAPDSPYHHVLGESLADEAAVWQQFLAQMSATSGPIFHYSPYERQALRQLNKRYGPDARVKPLLNRFVDLYPQVNKNIALPLTSYSLKKVAAWLGYEWSGVAQTAIDSIQLYQQWLTKQRRAYLHDILRYNEHDCRAMIVVKDWLVTF